MHVLRLARAARRGAGCARGEAVSAAHARRWAEEKKKDRVVSPPAPCGAGSGCFLLRAAGLLTSVALPCLRVFPLAAYTLLDESESGGGRKAALLDKVESEAQPLEREDMAGRGWAFVIWFYVMNVIMIMGILVEYNVDNHSFYCGHREFSLSRKGWFSGCFSEFLFLTPPSVMMFFFSIQYLRKLQPWSSVMRREADRLRVSRRRVRWVWSAKGFLVLGCATVFVLEAFVDLVSGDYPDGSPALLILDHLARIAAWLASIVITFYNYRNNQRHPGFLRVFWLTWTFGMLMRFANLVKGDITGFFIATYIVGFGAVLVLAVIAHLGMKRRDWEINELALFELEEREKRARHPDSWPEFAKVWKLFSPFWYLYAIGLAFCIAQGITTVLSLSQLGKLMVGDAKTPAALSKALAKFFAINVGLSFCATNQQAIFQIGGERVVRLIRERLFGNLLEQDRAYLDRKENTTGTLIARLTSDADQFSQTLTMQLSMVATPGVQVMSGFVVIVKMSARLAMLQVGIALITVLWISIRSKYITAWFSRRYSDARARSIGKGTEVLKCLDAVRLFVEEEKEKENFFSLLTNTYKIGRRKSIIEGCFTGVEMLIFFSVTATGLYFANTLRLNNEISSGDLATFGMVGMALVQSFNQVTNMLPQMAGVAGPATRIITLIERRPEKDGYIDMGKGDRPDDMKGEIVFDKVKFHYIGNEGGRPDLQLDCKVEAGSSLALVGRSGSGKSTTMSLMMRQYELGASDEGTVWIDGRDIKTLNPRWLLEQIGVIAQRAILFNDSLYYNVTYGRKGPKSHLWVSTKDGERTESWRVVSEEAFWHAVRQANAHDFIFPDIVDDEDKVGDDGEKLSGGQRQRTCIARVFLKNPKVLFLDEATSALDPEGEREVTQAMRNLSAGRTCVLIAHRLKTVQYANNIMVLDKGELVEAGSHDELVSKDGAYKRMLDSQEDRAWS